MRTALLAFLMLVPVSAQAADDVWREIKSPHFTVVSNGKEREAQEIAQEFEKIRVVYANGALAGLGDVVYAACENGVARDPEDPSIRDSRGLARALTGDKAGAIEDFEFALGKLKNPTFVATRTAWVEALRAGRNPFDAETLAKLDTWN